MLFEKLTKEDIERIDSYRHTFVGDCHHSRADLSEILKYWNKDKAWMEPYFGDSLIKEIPIEYKEEEDELMKKVSDFLWRSKDEYKEFIRQLQHLYPYPPYGLDHDAWHEAYEKHEAMGYITCTSSFVDNKVNLHSSKNSITFTLPNGEEYKVQNGMKTMKVLKKFAEVLEFKEFEEFRNAHSCCLQSKSLTGNLCLSIHPLDFMTMSDNECDWSSCMSWRDMGEYRLGTVEMMNSPVVICAYLKSKGEPLAWVNSDKTYEWNSKKWRCLFVVDRDKLCISIKSYPFYNSGLIKITMKEIAKLFNWGDKEPVAYDYDKYHHEAIVIDGQKVSLSMDTGAMYNDFGTTDHWIILGPTAKEHNLDDYFINYSGDANCMCCGSFVDYEEDCADTLTCVGDYVYCSCCDERISRWSDDWYWVEVEDERVCQYCAEEHAVWDTARGEYIWRDNAAELYLSKSNDKVTAHEECRFTWFKENASTTEWKYYFHELTKPRYDEEQGIYYVYPKDCKTFGFQELFNFDGDIEERLKEYMDEEDGESGANPLPSINPMEI